MIAIISNYHVYERMWDSLICIFFSSFFFIVALFAANRVGINDNTSKLRLPFIRKLIGGSIQSCCTVYSPIRQSRPSNARFRWMQICNDTLTVARRKMPCYRVQCLSFSPVRVFFQTQTEHTTFPFINVVCSLLLRSPVRSFRVIVSFTLKYFIFFLFARCAAVWVRVRVNVHRLWIVWVKKIQRLPL